MRRRASAAFVLPAVFVGLLSSPGRAADAPGVLFPVAFRVEHEMVRTDPDGARFRGEVVTDTYGGSTLVSVRPGGSRVIVDFARRTVTEVSVERSTYWTLTFSQMGDLARRLAAAEARPVRKDPRVAAAAPAEAIRVEEIAGGARDALSAPAESLAARPGARHFRASAGSAARADVWTDASVRLGVAALEALEGFEREALGAGAAGPAALVAAARRAAGGAVPVRVLRPLAEAGGTSEDVVSRLEALPAFPPNLLAVGEGFRRVASPLEEMVAFAEDEASRDSSRLVK